MTQWQPIETAPKDGKKVLIVANGVIYAAWWNSEFENQWDEETSEYRYVGAWTDDAVESFGYETVASYEPTHWMPLPDPPEAPTPQAGGQS